jgi:PadR family transcriptional regulator PadR
MASGDSDWNVEVRRGVLEFCVLSMIAPRPRYGYEIVQELASTAPIAAAEGTVYPLLRRLRNAGSLDAYWMESASGPPRQYYRITSAGRARLHAMRREWRALVAAVDAYATGEVAAHA